MGSGLYKAVKRCKNCKCLHCDMKLDCHCLLRQKGSKKEDIAVCDNHKLIRGEYDE